MANKNNPSRISWSKQLLYLACLVFLVVLIVAQRKTFADSLHTIEHISPWWAVAGFTALLLSVLASSIVYLLLSSRPLRFWRTAAVQAAGLGLNRVLPAGSGALGMSFLYLRANKLSNVTAGATVALNNLLGFVGHVILLGLAIALYPHVFEKFHGLSVGRFGPWLALGFAVVVALAVIYVIVRRNTQKSFSSLRPILDRPGRIGLALVFSMLLTICYVVAIMLAANALGYHVSIAAGIILLSFGVAAASAIPVPGGIGAAEAGVFAGMHAYGANNQDALAVALLYRLMTFWLPLIFGGVMFGFVIKWNLLRNQSSKAL